MPNQPDQTVPTPRRIPRVETTISNLGQSHALVARDPQSGVVTVQIGSTDQWVALSDDPAVLTVLLEDSIAQIDAIFAE